MWADLPRRLVRRVEFEHGKAQLERDVARLLAEAPPATGGGPTVGIATFGSGEWHLGIDLLLAHALQLRGANVQLLLCDLPGLPICDERTVHSRHQERCDGCISQKRSLVDLSGLRWLGLTQLVSADAVTQAIARTAALDASAIDAFTERGWPIGRWLHVSGCQHLRADEREHTPEHLAVRRRWLATAIVTVRATEAWLDRLRPDIVLVQGGAHARWRVARELAQARGIPVISREMGKGGWDRHIYARNADCMAPHLDEEWRKVRNLPLSAAEEATVDALLERLPEMTYAEGERTRLRPRAPHGRRTAVAFANVTWDLATAGRDVAFDGVYDWLSETIRLVERQPAARLVVRAHPAELDAENRERILERLRQQWPLGATSVEWVEPDDPVRAEALIDASDVVLAYNSTAGLEAAMRGRPVVLAGAPHFRGRGFTIDIDSRAEYRELLAAWTGGGAIAAAPEWRLLARRYFFLFFGRYTIPMGWTTSPLTPPYRLTVTSIDELRPGRNASLDVVCNAILHGHQPLLPREVACLA